MSIASPMDVTDSAAYGVSAHNDSSVTDDPATEKLVQLRSDIELLQAEYDSNGIPFWTVHDPLKSKFYRIGWLQFELLSRWSETYPENIIRAVNRDTTLVVTKADLQALNEFIVDCELVQIDDRSGVDRLQQHAERRSRGLLGRAFAFTMYYRLPLLNPDAFLNVLYTALWPLLRHTSSCLALVFMVAVFSIFGVISDWVELRGTFMLTMSPTGLLGYISALVAINIMHECGHGLVAKHYRCRVPVMGVALIFMLPVCYTNMSDAWKLPGRRKKLLIDAGGILIEAVIAVFALACWLILPDGVLRMLAFFVAVTSLATTLLINLNPFMKFDGYFILSDFIGTENLQNKSFANFKWELRRVLLGAEEPMPYPVVKEKLVWHRTYAILTLLYRVFLYFGIAYLVYTYWFKLMGFTLVAGVVFTMVILPVFKEVAQYPGIVKQQGFNVRSVSALAGVFLLLVLFVIPLPRKVTAAAVYTAHESSHVFAPQAAELQVVHVKAGQTVVSGELLFTLRDSSLTYQEKLLVEEISLLEKRLATELDSSGASSAQMVDIESINSKQAELNEVRSKSEGLLLRSSVAGEVVMLPDWLKSNTAVASNAVLAVIATTTKTEIRAYISAKDKDHLINGSAVFTDRQSTMKVPASVSSVSTNAITNLGDTVLAIPNGGSIPVLVDDSNRVVPKNDLYLSVLKPNSSNTEIRHELTGVVMFSAKARSLASSAFNRMYGVILRESGF